MPDSPVTSYDELQYDDLVFAYTQPANLATVATLHGLNPSPIEHCRVLDLGCAAGANLWPMALASPNGEFVGVDLSPKQIERGRETAATLGLSNLTLHARDIMESTADLGSFDYIIAHGLYSWVPPPVQERVLQVIHDHLAPNGVAYISYNTNPGWRLRGIVRDMMVFHAAGAGDPNQQTAQARDFLDFLLSALPDAESAYASIVRAEAELLRAQEDSYIFHEYLETENRPVYFHEFAARAAAKGLQYVCEATPQPLPGHIKPEVLRALAAVSPDRIRLEQYLDFLRCRIFRRNLLCHANVRPDFEVAVSRIPSMFVSTEANREVESPSDAPLGSESFLTPNKLRYTTSDPMMRAVMRRLLDAQPADASFGELLDAVKTEAPEYPNVEQELANEILQLYLGDIVTLCQTPTTLAAAAGSRPCAGWLARYEAAHGKKKIHNLRQRPVEPDPFARYLLPLLDGTRDRASIVDALAQRASAGEFEVRSGDGNVVVNPAEMRPVLADWVEQALHRLGQLSLMTA